MNTEQDILTDINTAWNALGERRAHDVYHNKILVRKDYMVNSPEGKAMVDKLQKKFPNYANWDRISKNFLGEYGAYRKPYKNHSITWYDVDTAISDDILNVFNIECDRSKLFSWYAYKFDLVTDEVMLKVGYNDIDNKPQLLPNNIWYYAATYVSDGTVGDWYDIYACETKEYMRKFCEDHNLEWPLSDDFSDHVLLWGLVYNRYTLEYKSVKAYTCDIL